jgi:hypothetical protein
MEMRSISLMGLVAALAAVACGAGSVTLLPATASSVSLTSGDIPKGLVECDGSGDIDTFLGKIKTSDPNSYQTNKDEWAQTKKDGAVKGSVVLGAESKAVCTQLESSSSNSGSTKELASFVIQFKDVASATKAYASDAPILGFKPSDLTSGSGAVKGTKTGLGANSTVEAASLNGESVYVAVWQNKAFYILYLAINIDDATSKKLVTAINGRVK